MPSLPGIVRSSVLASGRCRRHSSSASSPLRPVATTSKPALSSAVEISLRMNAESSLTTTRLLLAPPSVIGLCLGRHGEVGAAEDATGVEQDHEPVAHLGDALDRVGARGGDLVELALVDRQPLVDVVDDDAGGHRAGLDDHDLAGHRLAVAQTEPGGQVADGHDLAAQ